MANGSHLHDPGSWAEHLVIIHPLWIGAMPALLKAFFEQALWPRFAMAPTPNGGWNKPLSGRSPRAVVRMGMPAFVYRWYFGAHGLKGSTQILALVGIKPRRSILVGMTGNERHEAAGLALAGQCARVRRGVTR